MRYLVLSAAVAMAPMPRAQPSAPIQLEVGSPLVDGRIYKAHEAWAKRTVTKDGAVVRSIQYTNSTFLTRWKGVDACVVESKPNAETTDTAFYEKTVLDARSMALLHREERNGAGRLLIADVDGAHVTGQYRAKAGEAIEALDFTLDVPSYYVAFVDAAVGATHIQPGQSWRVPTFSFGPARRKTDWQVYRITDRTPGGWVIENVDDTQAQTTIWLTDDPPYLPLVTTKLPDGSVARFESKVLDTPACTAAEYHQFDFWIGDWTVTQNGAFAGTNTIDRPFGGCVLQEHWVGAHGTRGSSFNVYDATRKQWHQTWVDSNGSLLLLDGAFADGKMTLSGTTGDDKGRTVWNRIVWQRVRGDSSRVRQVWETSTDGGKTWRHVFDGLYTRDSKS